MATVAQNKPHSRYMTFFHDQLTLYTATSKETHKVDDLEHNPYVHIIIGYTFDGLGDEYIEIEGSCAIHDDQAMKEKLWNDQLKPWFDGPHDPNYLVLKITPSLFTLKNSQGGQEQLYQPEND